MEKLPSSPDPAMRDIDRLADLFPMAVTEVTDPAGNLTRAIDFDLLRRRLGGHVVEGAPERYQLDWPGKGRARRAAREPASGSLRPRRAESSRFDATRNLFIEGDNLDVLKLLQESFLGRIKIIYIDPPYNTGNDFLYDDDFSQTRAGYLAGSGQVGAGGVPLVANPESGGRFHSDWLSMMYPRLALARNLLTDDGVIFISIDDHEIDNLRKICAEIFGEQNFVAQIVWQKVYAPKNTARWFSEDHDYIVVFARNRDRWQPLPLARTERMEARYRNPDNDPRGPWKPENMSARNRYDAGVYPITTPSGRLIEGPPRGSYWRISRQRFDELDADGRIWWGSGGDNAPAVKRFLSEVAAGRTPQTLWFYGEVGHTQDAKKTLLRYVPFEHTVNVLNSVKPVELLQRILQLAGRPGDGDIVLDFFGGSATTAHAVLAQNLADGGNRRFISVQIPEPLPVAEAGLESIFEIGLTRVRNVAAEISAADPSLDVGFRVLRLDSANLADVRVAPGDLDQASLIGHADRVRPGRTAEDLLFQVLLDSGLDPGTPILREHVDGHEVFVTGELVACLAETVSPAVVRAIAARRPPRAVLRDSAFAADADRINADQVFAELSPATDLRVL
ncbi:site-specific DNA-methyltransferase [Actinoplanes sp. NEAU-A12]|uniref:Site-specific DNA-methyltransferase n=1 Tax=Actinoplanes sandaracinus TaxID=3045177 RepID=A0ABT6WTJ8_9ACTN|nr:site-specific DNA-methyltransferase [Actinoplanes sandaracinus]MDI6103082.1 site-specific DNA-methyltransferase [Actinoplanes sandaracinus]